MATFNDVQTEGFSGFLGGALNSDKQHYSDLNKQGSLIDQALGNVKKNIEVEEFSRFAPTREAEDALKMEQARRKLPMVQEMLNSDLEGKKAQAAMNYSHGRLFGEQADSANYGNAATRIDAINQLLRRLPPDQALQMRMRLNPVMQNLAQRMTGRPQGEFMGSNELEATAAAGINTPAHQQSMDKKMSDMERALAVAQAKGDVSLQIQQMRGITAAIIAGMRGANGKVDPTSFKAQLDQFNKTRTPLGIIAKGQGLLSILNDENDMGGLLRKSINSQMDAALAGINSDPSRQPPKDVPKGSPMPDPRNPNPTPKSGNTDLPRGVTRDD